MPKLSADEIAVKAIQKRIKAIDAQIDRLTAEKKAAQTVIAQMAKVV